MPAVGWIGHPLGAHGTPKFHQPSWRRWSTALPLPTPSSPSGRGLPLPLPPPLDQDGGGFPKSALRGDLWGSQGATPQERFKTAPNGQRAPQRDAQISPNPKEISCVSLSRRFASNGHPKPQDGSNMAQEGPRSSPRQPQDRPKSARSKSAVAVVKTRSQDEVANKSVFRGCLKRNCRFDGPQAPFPKSFFKKVSSETPLC